MNLLRIIAKALDSHDYPDFKSPVPSEGSMLRARVVVEALGLREERDDDGRMNPILRYVTAWRAA